MEQAYGSFGEMEPNPHIERKTPVTVPCSKCKGSFNVGKEYHELYIRLSGFGIKKDGTLTPRTCKDVALYQLCSGCFNKFEGWICGK